jgi:hypothetical protein
LYPLQPGAYTPGSSLGHKAALKSAFKSGTDRFGERASTAAAATPSPGTYNVHVVTSSFRPNGGAPSAAFKSTSQRSNPAGLCTLNPLVTHSLKAPGFNP